MIRHLGTGRDSARSIGDLAESLGWSRRRVERELERMVIEDHVPVIACSQGVYLASTAAETRTYILSLKGRMSAISARIRALEKWAAEQEQPQPSIWDVAA